jgi:hypothetical protein
MVRENQAYWLRAVGLWFLLMTAETLQGQCRVKALALWIGDEFARDVGVFTGLLMILLITFACVGWIPLMMRGRCCGWVRPSGFNDRLRTHAGTLCV